MYDVIAFDADDTLWHNEPHFHETQRRFGELLSRYHAPEWIAERLYATELRNLRHFGYGIKGFTLSMIETAIELTEGRVSGDEVRQVLEWGREMTTAPVELLDGVADTIRALAGRYRLMLVTKGDLFDQEGKLARSGLGDFFDVVEVTADKTPATYAGILQRHGVASRRFLMVGNSLRSDVLPVLDVGGTAIHIPYPLTWAHEQVDPSALEGRPFVQLERIGEVPGWLEAAGAQG